MSASPEFHRPWSAAPQLYSPRVLPGATSAAEDDQDEYYYSCRTPTGAGISSSYPGGSGTTACPPAPRKPRPQPAACRKRLFDAAAAVISVRYDELDRIFRPAPPPSAANANAPSKQRRSPGKLRGGAASLNQVMIHNQ